MRSEVPMRARLPLFALIVTSAIGIAAVAAADAPAINSMQLPRSASVDACVSRGMAALQLAQFQQVGRVAETAYAYRNNVYTARIHCFADGGGVAIVAGPDTQVVTAYVMQIAGAF
jgi:hypothetical protein